MHQFDQHIEVYSQYDPTRTTSLRNAFSREMNKRFNELVKVIRLAIVDQDCFGLNKIHVLQMSPPGQEAFAFPRSAEKVEAFMQWLQVQVDKGIITLWQYQQVGEAIEKAWTDLYILDSYKRGIDRARREMLAAGMAIPSVEASGGLSVIAGTPFHLDRVGVLYTRVYNELKGITDAMSKTISEILTQGMIDGLGPRQIARQIVAAINGTGLGELGLTDKLGRFLPASRRAEILARTELVRAYHLAAIQEYRNWGVRGVKIRAEWRTARDARVCERCGSLEGRVFTLDEIEPMIPLHPQCRCLALPIFEH